MVMLFLTMLVLLTSYFELLVDVLDGVFPRVATRPRLRSGTLSSASYSGQLKEIIVT